MAGSLTTKQEMFCLEYMKDFNGTQAAIRAGYSKRTANRQSAENMAKPVIKDRINQLMSELIDDKNKMIIENIQFWTEIRNGLDEDADMKDRLKASEYLGKYAAMFTENLNHMGQVTLNVTSDDAKL